MSTKKQHQSFFNSTQAKRGVGILISKSLNFKVDSESKDIKENIIGVFKTIDNTKIGLISIYGLNSNDFGFFCDLERIIEEHKDYTLIIGGDWNLTYSVENSQANIDILNMASTPSQERSRRLQGICEKRNLVDPYRVLWPSSQLF